MDISERIQSIVNQLEDATSYEDIGLVEDARKELLFLLEDLDSDFPLEMGEDF
jgi:hypothetical protein